MRCLRGGSLPHHPSLFIYLVQTVALVGASGSGKSTVVSLLERFYAPRSGTITIGGRDISDIPVKSLREHLGIVTQEPILFLTVWRQIRCSGQTSHIALEGDNIMHRLMAFR